jgi:hypothetical protein
MSKEMGGGADKGNSLYKFALENQTRMKSLAEAMKLQPFSIPGLGDMSRKMSLLGNIASKGIMKDMQEVKLLKTNQQIMDEHEWERFHQLMDIQEVSLETQKGVLGTQETLVKQGKENTRTNLITLFMVIVSVGIAILALLKP